MAGIKIVNLPALGRNLASTDLFELSLAGGTGSRKITGQEILNTAKSGLVPTSRTLTINGTTQDLSADRTFTISTGITIGTTAITSGTVGRVLFEGTGNVVSESANLFWDNTNKRLGIGTSSPEQTLHINSSSIDFLKMSQTGRTGYIQFTNGTAGTNQFQPRILGVEQGSNFAWELVGQASSDLSNDLPVISIDARNISSALSNRRLFGIGSYILGINSYKFVIASTGNVLINTTTDAGFKLDVNGTARVVGNARTLASLITPYNNSSSSYLGLTSDFSGTNGFIIPFSESPYGSGRTRIINTYSDGAIEFYTSKGTDYSVSYSAMFTTSGNLLLNTATDNGYKLDVNGTARVRTTASSYASALLVENTGSAGADNVNVATFQGNRGNASTILDNTSVNIWQKNNIVNNYTLVNFLNSIGYLSAYIGAQNLSHGSGQSGNLIFGTVASGGVSTKMTIFSGGNVGIGTSTDAGFKLDVNGTSIFRNTLGLVSNNPIQLAVTTNGNTRILSTNNDIILNAFSTTIEHSCGTYGIRKRMMTIYGDAQSNAGVSIGVDAVNVASAILSADSTTKGFLPPRMTQVQRNAIASPAIGLEIYQTDATEGKYIYKSAGWTYIG